MTLCIAWRNRDKISFSSDSRISTSDSKYVDIGIKIMDIPVCIKNPVPQETGIETTAYDHRLGLCYCGHTITAHLIKETIHEVLQRLQLAPGYTDFSLNGVCRIIAKFIENTADNLRAGLGWNDPIVEFLIGGLCPDQQRVMVYRFIMIDQGDHYEAQWKEVLTNENDQIIMGSGTQRAEEIILSKGITPGNHLLKVLRDVCKDDTVPSVGGYLQYGHFVKNNFEIKGIVDYDIDVDGTIEYIFAYRGTTLYKDKFENAENDFHIAGNFIMAFEDEIQEYWRQKELE